MAAAGAVAVTIGDPRYPQALREIFDPPIVLFARGRVELLSALSLAVVGTRRATPYGMAVAERLSSDLAHAGLAIASGMARGIDTAAHKGALAGGRRHHRSARLRRGRGVPVGESRADGGAGAQGIDRFRIPHGNHGVPAELPHPQPRDQRHQPGSAGGRGGAV